MTRLADLTTESLAAIMRAGKPVVALVPVGSVEPHGPHLPLGTDSIISEAAAERALAALDRAGVTALIAPSVPYGVTHFAAGFAGAISVPAAALTAFLRAVVEGYLAGGFAHVCLINNHLEPAHDTAVREAIRDVPLGRASVACPLTVRWARTLSSEFKSGACHAGRYESSIVLAAAPGLVQREAMVALPPLGVSLSRGIKEGLTSFREMGLDKAYTGAPGDATAEEGDALLDKLAAMISAEVVEALGLGGEGA